MRGSAELAARCSQGLSLVAVAMLGVACHTETSARDAQTSPPSPAGPVISGWEAMQDGVACRHPAVTSKCENGWCRIPAGCFLMGSPESEYGRGLYTEPLTAVTLTHAFEIGQFETTQKQWLQIATTNPIGPTEELSDCTDPQCPLTHVTWFDALEFANRLSQRHEPPLSPCYTLTNCQGALGEGLSCAEVSLTAATLYDCGGYRLPTEAEWEYAARAGTRTAFYSGDISVTEGGTADPSLEPIAWYAPNAARQTHPVGQKAPNQWLLYDVLGNVDEWTSDYAVGQDPPGPLTDPSSFQIAGNRQTSRVTKGGRAIDWPTTLRAASRDYPPWSASGQGLGFRLVRSLM